MTDSKLETLAALIKTIERICSLLDNLNTIVDRATILRRNHNITNGLIAKLLCNLANCKEIAERFTHFAVINIDISVMHPIMRKIASISAFRLCNLVLMVRENKVLTTAMDINGLAQISSCHSRAFNMPTRSALPPR